MDATPVNMSEAALPGGMPFGGRPPFERASAEAVSAKWSALHDATAVVGALAGIPMEPMTPEQRALPAAVVEAESRRRARAQQAIDDLAAMMEPGLSALLAVHARGADASAPARALWEEFCAARDGVMALLWPAGGLHAR